MTTTRVSACQLSRHDETPVQLHLCRISFIDSGSPGRALSREPGRVVKEGSRRNDPFTGSILIREACLLVAHRLGAANFLDSASARARPLRLSQTCPLEEGFRHPRVFSIGLDPAACAVLAGSFAASNFGKLHLLGLACSS